jgi:plastocyanin
LSQIGGGMRYQFFCVLTLLLGLPAACAATGNVTNKTASFSLVGQINLTSLGRPLRSSEAVDGVVYFRTKQPMPLKPPATPLQMRTVRKAFSPSILPIVQGSKVSFPNLDPILHNVFSPPGLNSFDVGLYGKGEGETVQFDNVGVVRLFCNVHPQMFAHIIVLDTPIFAIPGSDGRYQLRGLPAGEGELFVWHQRGLLWRQKITIAQDQTVDINIELSKRRVPDHLNKFGKPYKRSSAGEY